MPPASYAVLTLMTRLLCTAKPFHKIK